MGSVGWRLGGRALSPRGRLSIDQAGAQSRERGGGRFRGTVSCVVTRFRSGDFGYVLDSMAKKPGSNSEKSRVVVSGLRRGEYTGNGMGWPFF